VQGRLFPTRWPLHLALQWLAAAQWPYPYIQMALTGKLDKGKNMAADLRQQDFIDANTVQPEAKDEISETFKAVFGRNQTAAEFTAFSKDFYNQIQANNATASQATVNGLKMLHEAGFTPEQAAQLWNAAYGSNFTGADYTRELVNNGIVQAVNPQLAVFGDSISSVVGYNEDTTADTSSGLNLAQYLGTDLKMTAANNAIGGQTSSDALNGTSIPFAGAEIPIAYGSYGSYLANNNPETVVLRFGAADAIRLNDPALSISNIEKMLQMAQQN
jgi:hypothetical protein